ncbi:hypothetical protein I6A60_04780 [Frankia sp. AgB1.9]|uniref:hypothetical protein n=1 Tax=Frankia sp. AgB1.9 TaxID=1836968 RepID=UPI0019332F9B|nr:hypothetical protein [Frankia sp. AgB1.9]MBL7547195.1 hypothetical protein [Frankia sp. AgB1.9]
MSAEPNAQPTPQTSAADGAAELEPPAPPSAPPAPAPWQPPGPPAATDPRPAGPPTAADLVAGWATPDPGPTQGRDRARLTKSVATTDSRNAGLPGSAPAPAANPAWSAPTPQPVTDVAAVTEAQPVAGAVPEVGSASATGPWPTASGHGPAPASPAGGPPPFRAAAGPARPAPLAAKAPRRLLLAGLSTANVLIYAVVGFVLLGLLWIIIKGTDDGKPTAAGQPTATPAEVTGGPNPTATPVDPFQGLDLTKYGLGADGIVLPAAAPAGRFSAAEVASDLDLSKQLLVAALLDPRTMAGDPADYYQLLPPDSAADIRDWIASIPTGRGNSTMFTMLAPGVSLADPEIPIASTITFDAEPYEGYETLQVKTNLAVVYELRRGTDVRVVVRQFVQNFTFYHPRDVANGASGPYVSSPGGGGFCLDEDEFGRGLIAGDATEADPTCAGGVLSATPTPA